VQIPNSVADLQRITPSANPLQDPGQDPGAKQVNVLPQHLFPYKQVSVVWITRDKNAIKSQFVIIKKGEGRSQI
jgi:hypothetical protein